MRYFFAIVIILCSCTSNDDRSNQKQVAIHKETAATQTYYSKEISSNVNIINTTGRKIIVLYNSVDGFLPKSDTNALHFSTECMGCEPVQLYKDHLVFAHQMEVFPDRTTFHKKELTSIDSSGYIKRVSGYGNEKSVSFSFSDGKGSIKHIRQSCNDAELKEVVLIYRDGEVKINNVLNASFFEYDLNKDGRPEQFIFASRNCSQELAIIQIL